MTAPALAIAIPLLLGVALGSDFCPPSPPLVATLLMTWTACALVIFLRPRTPRRMAVATTAAMVLASGGTACAGVLLGATAARQAERPSLLAAFASGPVERTARLVGVLREDAASAGTAVSLTIDVTEIDGRTVDGGVRVSVAGTLALEASREWRAGRTLAVDAQLHEPFDYRDAGVPSDRARLARQGIVLLGSVKSAALVQVRAQGSAAAETAARIRRFVRAATADAIGRWSPVSAGVVTAILIGDRTGLSADDERRLQEAGTYHVIAISGGNIAVLTALIVVLGRTARLPSRPTAAASIAFLAFYGYTAGLAPSVLRATVAGMIYLAARAADHRGAALNAVGVAAAFACVTSPLSILDAGFILSFGATFAIILGVERVTAVAHFDRRDRSAGLTRATFHRVARAAIGLGAATLCAEIALAPIGARLFGRVSVAGLILNFAAIPLMSIIQITGLLAVALVRVAPPAAYAAGWIAHIGTVALLRSARLVDMAPWLVRDVPPPVWWVVALWYAGSAAVLLVRGQGGRLAAGLVAVNAGLLLWAGPPFARAVRVPAAPPGWTRVTVLDVGQGDAVLIQPARTLPVLVDAGGVPAAGFDLGRRVTLPALWALGVQQLGILVLTHGDPDHIGGAPPLLRALTPGEIWEGVPVPRHEPMQRLHAAADRAGIPWISRTAGASIGAAGVTVRVLNPLPPDWERQRVRNDDSIVLEMRVGAVAFVLPGDITQAVEPAVIARADAAPFVIVKAPHHGSAGSSSPLFVAALHPSVVLFSAGRRNPFGHPAASIVARYRTAGGRVFSTAEDGAIVVDTNGTSVVVWCPATGRREAFMVRGR